MLGNRAERGEGETERERERIGEGGRQQWLGEKMEWIGERRWCWLILTVGLNQKQLRMFAEGVNQIQQYIS